MATVLVFSSREWIHSLAVPKSKKHNSRNIPNTRPSPKTLRHHLERIHDSPRKGRVLRPFSPERDIWLRAHLLPPALSLQGDGVELVPGLLPALGDLGRRDETRDPVLAGVGAGDDGAVSCPSSLQGVTATWWPWLKASAPFGRVRPKSPCWQACSRLELIGCRRTCRGPQPDNQPPRRRAGTRGPDPRLRFPGPCRRAAVVLPASQLPLPLVCARRSCRTNGTSISVSFCDRSGEE